MELQLKSNYQVTIEHTLNGGYLVGVGCARFSYTSAAQLCRDLKAYLEDPEKYEQKYNEMMDDKHRQLHPTGGGTRLSELPVAPPEAEQPMTGQGPDSQGDTPAQDCEPDTSQVEIPGQEENKQGGRGEHGAARRFLPGQGQTRHGRCRWRD